MKSLGSVTFKSSRLRALLGAVFCLGFAYALDSMRGNRGFIDTLAGGGLSGKMAFATILLVGLGLFALGALIYRPRAIIVGKSGVIVGKSGVKVRSIKGEAQIKWNDIKSVEVGGALLRRGAVLETKEGLVLIADGMGNTRKIVNAIREFKDLSTVSRSRRRPA